MGALAGPVVNILRMLFIAIMQSAAIAGLFAFVEKFVDYIRDTLKKDGKLSDSETDDVMLNTVIVALTGTAVTLASLKTRLPIRLADKLGLKVGRTQKTQLTPNATASLASSQVTNKLSGTLLKTVLISFVGSLVTSIVWLPGLIQQFGDQASFAPKAANDYYEKFLGIRPFTEPNPLDSPGSFTPAEFNDYARSLEAAGVVGIEYGFPKGTILYSRNALAELIDYVSGQQALRGLSPTVAKVKPLLAPYLRTNTGKPLTNTTTSTASTSTTTKPGGASTSAAASLPAAGAGASTYTPVKVFTGVLSNGTLGAAQPFSAREDDLINSAEELRDVAQTNAAAFIASIPGRIVYEIKIVNSVIASDGTKRTGATVQVPNGKTASGAVKYKYVTNKFATLTLYYVKGQNTRTKLADITLGPTDIARFNPTGAELNGVGQSLVTTVSTRNTDDITRIISGTTTTTETTQSQESIPLPNYNLQQKVPGDTGYRFYIREVNPGDFVYRAIEWVGNVPYAHISITEEEYRRKTGDTKDYTNSGYKFVDNIPVRDFAVTPSPFVTSSAAPLASTPTGSNGQTKTIANLTEYYASINKPLPSLSERGQTYQSYGLGSASLYTGTVEQNTKLLNKLLGR